MMIGWRARKSPTLEAACRCASPSPLLRSLVFGIRGCLPQSARAAARIGEGKRRTQRCKISSSQAGAQAKRTSHRTPTKRPWCSVGKMRRCVGNQSAEDEVKCAAVQMQIDLFCYAIQPDSVQRARAARTQLGKIGSQDPAEGESAASRRWLMSAIYGRIMVICRLFARDSRH